MVARSSLFIVVSLLFLIGAASALPDLMVISSDKSEMGIIANNHDTATITVLLYEGSTPVSDIQVNFTVINPVMGTIDPVTVVTGGDGRATAIFTAGIQPGNAEIRADSATLINTTSQVIVAPVPDDTSYIESPVEWLIANGFDKATISVYAYNSSPSFSNYPISGLQVQFSVNNSIFGTFSPVTAVTNSDGLAQSTFTTGKKSGVALFYGNISYEIDNLPYTECVEPLEQKIDHDTPYRISDYNYSYRVDVGEITHAAFTFTDRWENPVDNRRIAEEVYFAVSSESLPPKGPGFVNGSNSSQTITIPVDFQGKAQVDVKTDEVPGYNRLEIYPLMYDDTGNLAVSNTSLDIEGIPGKPVRIQADFTPSDFRQVANNKDLFYINYTLWDKFDNLVQNRSLMVDTNIPGEGKIVGTNAHGLAMVTYGPKKSIGMVVINATALDNTSVFHSQQVWFVSQEPADMLFTANPQTMPSRDVPAGVQVLLIATVVDELGNPVEGEEVTFGIEPGTITYDEPNYNIINQPEIPVTSAITDEFGDAVVQFLPGGFTTTPPNYDGTATGRCNVTATWQGITRSIPVIWKNYPYLSVESYASSNIVEINETVDITVLLKGDGWALQPKPIDVILTTDRSGSMLFDNPDRMHSIREAEKIFVDQLSASRDRIGLVTFGRNGYISRPGVNSGIATSEINNVYNPYSRTYSAYATYDRSLTNNFLDVKTQIGRILPDHGTPMREGLRLSIRNLIQSARPDAIRAVIVLSDGDYNWYGDPLARGNGYTGYDADDYGDLTQNYFYYTSLNSSNQNMSQYAKNNNIKIYSIAYADTISAGGRQTLETLALSSGGKYYNASASNIEEVYAAIAGDLKTDAGVNTMVDLDYNAVEVNYTIEYNNESNPIFDYVYVDGVSTRLDSYFTDSTVMTIPDLPWIFDNTSQWSTNKKLDFSLGTVRLHQVWDIRYRLKAQKPGLYNMFGPNSTIVFNNGTQTLYLPDLFVTVIPNMIDTTVWSADLNYTYIGENSSSDNQDYYITFDINSNYTGSPDSTITETYYFVTYDGQRYEMDSRQLTYTEANQLRQYSVYVGRLPVGWQYFEPVMEGFEPNSPVISPTHPIIPPAPPKDSYFTLT